MLNAHDGARFEMSNVFCDADISAYFEDALSSGLSTFSWISLSLTVISGVGCMEGDLHSVNTLTTSLSTANQKNDDLSTDSSSTQFSIKDSFAICDDNETSTNQQSIPSLMPLSLNSYLRTTTPRALFQSQGHRHRDKLDGINTHRKQLGKKRPLKSSGVTPLNGPRLDWAQKLILLKESFETKKALFVDDLSFIREVHGRFSLAPEMDIELEFKTLSKTFTRWKSDFKVIYICLLFSLLRCFLNCRNSLEQLKFKSSKL